MTIQTMNTDELLDEFVSLNDYLDECSIIGQGYSTKDTVRMHALTDELYARRATFTFSQLMSAISYGIVPAPRLSN